MSTHMTRGMLALCLCTISLQAAGAESDRSRDVNDVQVILDAIRSRLATIWNYQCVQATASIQQTHQSRRPSLGYARKQLAFDDQGRGRVKIPMGLSVDTYLWDGERTFIDAEHTAANGTVTHSARIVRGQHYQVRGQNTPWRCLGGELIDLISRATETGAEIRVEETEAGHCRLEIHYDTGGTVATVLDPTRGYLPVAQEVYIEDDLRSREEFKFKSVPPGLWFPVEIYRSFPAPRETPAIRFTNIAINDPDFADIFEPMLPAGTEVHDRVRGEHYVVGNKSTLRFRTTAASASMEETRSDAWQDAFDAVYRLADGQVLKLIAPPFIPERRLYILNREPHLRPLPDELVQNRLYVFQWDDDLKARAGMQPGGFLPLPRVLDVVCGLAAYEYEGTPNSPSPRLAGDWIVRKGASKDRLLKALESIICDETGRRIVFAKQRVETPAVRVSGAYECHPLPLALRDDEVFVFCDPAQTPHRSASAGRGTLDQFCRHLCDLIGLPVTNATESTNIEIIWHDDKTWQLRDIGPRDGQDSDERLASLLENLAQQTSLEFTMESDMIDKWHVTEAAMPAAKP